MSHEMAKEKKGGGKKKKTIKKKKQEVNVCHGGPHIC